MNKKSQKFLVWSLILTVIPLMIGSVLVKGNQEKEILNIPVNVENVAFEYIYKDIEEENSNNNDELIDAKIYNYDFISQIHDLSFVVEQESNNQVLLYSVEVEKYDDKYIVMSSDVFRYNNPKKVKYLVLSISILIYIACIYTAAICFGRCTEDKWKRSLFIMSGIGTITYNWATGYINFSLISIAIPVVGIEYGGNHISYTLLLHAPIGLLMYWMKWYKKLNNSQNMETESVNNYV